MIQIDDIKKILTDKMEDEEMPKKLLEWLKANEGKKLTVRNAPEGFDIRKRHGMTFVSMGSFEFLIAHSEKNVEVPSEEVFIQKNGRYFGAAEIRNQNRRNLLDNPERLQRIVDTINNYVTASAEMEKMFGLKAEVVDQYAMLRLIEKQPYIVKAMEGILSD